MTQAAPRTAADLAVVRLLPIGAILLDPLKPAPERSNCGSCGEPMKQVYRIRYNLCNRCILPGVRPAGKPARREDPS